MFDAPCAIRVRFPRQQEESVPPKGLPQFSRLTLRSASGDTSASPDTGNAKRRKTMTNENQKSTEKTSVAYDAHIVEPRDRMKPFWHRIGTAWAHENGEGFTFRIPPGVSVSGEIVFRKRKPADEQTEQ